MAKLAFSASSTNYLHQISQKWCRKIKDEAGKRLIQ